MGPPPFLPPSYQIPAPLATNYPATIGCGGGKKEGPPLQKPPEPGGVRQVHRLKDAVVKHSAVVEHAGQGLGLFQRVHLHQGTGDAQLSAHLTNDVQAVGHIGALVAVVDRQRLLLDGPGPGPVREAGEGAVEGAGQQGVAVIRFVHCLKAVLLGEGLVGQPRLLLLRPQHTDAGPALGPGVRQAGLQQRPAVPLALVGPGYPQAVEVQVVIPLYRDPGGLQRGVLDEDLLLHVQLPEHVALRQPVCQPPALGLHAGVGLFAADDAAQVLAWKGLGGQVDECSVHLCPRFLGS